MFSFPEVSSGTLYSGDSQDTGYSGSSTSQAVSSYESMDAGLTITTQEGDVVTLSTSRYSSVSAYQYSSQGSVSGENAMVTASYTQSQVELASGETFSFSVEGDLNEQELADIESIISGIDSIIYEMAEGDMDEAVALALSMGTYDSVSGYEADITMTQAYASYTETTTTESLASQGNSGASFLPSSSFIDDVSQLFEKQEADALAYAQQPLTQLFDYYLEQQAEKEAAEPDDADDIDTELAETDPIAEALKSPAVIALENTARTVEQLIQSLVKEAFDTTFNELA